MPDSREPWRTRLLLAVVVVVAGVLPEGAICREYDVLTNNWVVELNHAGGERVARSVAAETGFTFVSPVSTRVCLAFSCCRE